MALDQNVRDDAPAVSVIIPTYNRGACLPKVIDSVLAQTCQDFEIIVADDGSTDDTTRLMASYEDHVVYKRMEHTGYPAIVRNEALRHARGRYIAFLDSDDLWLPHKLAKQVHILDNQPDTGFICANAYVVTEFEQEVSDRLFDSDGRGKSGWILEYLVSQGCFINTPAVVVRRSILDQTGMFCEAPEVNGIEDFDLWLRIAAITEVYYDPKPLAIYWDHHATSIRGRRLPLEVCRSRLFIHDRLRMYLAQHQLTDAVSDRVWRRKYFILHSHFLANYWVSGHYYAAFISWLRMMGLRPIEAVNLALQKSVDRSGRLIRRLIPAD